MRTQVPLYRSETALAREAAREVRLGGWRPVKVRDASGEDGAQLAKALGPPAVVVPVVGLGSV